MNRRSSYADLGKARATIAKQKLRYRARTGSGTAPRLRVEWTGREEELVLRREMPDRELAAYIGRSVAAVQIRRCLLRKNALDEQADAVRDQGGGA